MVDIKYPDTLEIFTDSIKSFWTKSCLSTTAIWDNTSQIMFEKTVLQIDVNIHECHRCVFVQFIRIYSWGNQVVSSVVSDARLCGCTRRRRQGRIILRPNPTLSSPEQELLLKFHRVIQVLSGNINGPRQWASTTSYLIAQFADLHLSLNLASSCRYEA